MPPSHDVYTGKAPAQASCSGSFSRQMWMGLTALITAVLPFLSMRPRHCAHTRRRPLPVGTLRQNQGLWAWQCEQRNDHRSHHRHGARQKDEGGRERGYLPLHLTRPSRAVSVEQERIPPYGVSVLLLARYSVLCPDTKRQRAALLWGSALWRKLDEVLPGCLHSNLYSVETSRRHDRLASLGSDVVVLLTRQPCRG